MTLSKRELEVLQLLAEGYPRSIIALKLDITIHTAHFHITRIMSKLGVKTSAEAAAMAVRLGLVPVEPGSTEIRFTPRELEVLKLVTKGLSNSAVGSALGISLWTVKFHVMNVMSKMGADSRTGVAAEAVRMGIA